MEMDRFVWNEKGCNSTGWCSPGVVLTFDGFFLGQIYSYHNPVFSFIRFMTWWLAFLGDAKNYSRSIPIYKTILIQHGYHRSLPITFLFSAVWLFCNFIKWEAKYGATLNMEGHVYRFRATVQETYAFLLCILVMIRLLVLILYVSVISTCVGMPGELQIQNKCALRHHKNIVQDTHST